MTWATSEGGSHSRSSSPKQSLSAEYYSRFFLYHSLSLSASGLRSSALPAETQCNSWTWLPSTSRNLLRMPEYRRCRRLYHQSDSILTPTILRDSMVVWTKGTEILRSRKALSLGTCLCLDSLHQRLTVYSFRGWRNTYKS